MKNSVKKVFAEKKLPINRPNRTQGKTLPLCDCKMRKRDHFNNALGHTYRGNNNFKNNLSVKDSENG